MLVLIFAVMEDGCNTPIHAHVAQSVEHFLGKEEVTGSIPVMSTIFYDRYGYRPARAFPSTH